MKQRSSILGRELVVVGSRSLIRAQRRVAACEACSSAASRPFHTVVAEVLGSVGLEFVLSEPAHCPKCNGVILERTLVRCSGELEGTSPVAPGQKSAVLECEDTEIVLIGENILAEAEAALASCDACGPSGEITFDYVLDSMTRRDPSVTEYLMCRAARCPSCRGDVTEKTFVMTQ